MTSLQNSEGVETKKVPITSNAGSQNQKVADFINEIGHFSFLHCIWLMARNSLILKKPLKYR